MRHAIIKSLDILIWVVAALMAIGGVIAGIVMLIQGEPVGLLAIIGGFLYAIIFAGTFFLLMGTYENTKRTAEAVEKLAGR